MAWLEKLKEYKSVNEIRNEIISNNKKFNYGNLHEIIIIGAANEGLRLVSICRQQNIGIIAICDDDPKRKGNVIEGITVSSLSGLKQFDCDTPVIIASHRVLKAYNLLKEIGFKHVAPFALLEVIYPHIFNPHMFYDGLLEDLFENSAHYEKLSTILADDLSRSILDALLGFRMTFNPVLLSPIIEWELYKPKALFSYEKNEVYVDGGSFDGDTIRLFIKRVHGEFSRILAFEPDKKTFKRLTSNFAYEKRVETMNIGLHRKKTTLYFDDEGTRGSLIVQEGKVKIQVAGLDEILKGERVSFIKLNIEGAEIEALEGAKTSIQQHIPKLAISAYHLPSHLWQVADKIMDIHPDYQLYLRQHDGGIIETVLYALPKINPKLINNNV